MYGSMFYLDMGAHISSRERWYCGRSLATALSAVDGFVAFLILETADDTVAGFCICIDAPSLENARRVAEDWQHMSSGQEAADIKALITGEVIIQRGF